MSSPRAGSWRTASAAACTRASRAWPRSTTSSTRAPSTSPPASTRSCRPCLAGTRSTGAPGRRSSTSASRSGERTPFLEVKRLRPFSTLEWDAERQERQAHGSIAGRGPRSSRASASTRAPRPSSRRCGRRSRPSRAARLLHAQRRLGLPPPALPAGGAGPRRLQARDRQPGQRPPTARRSSLARGRESPRRAALDRGGRPGGLLGRDARARPAGRLPARRASLGDAAGRRAPGTARARRPTAWGSTPSPRGARTTTRSR